MADFNMYGAKSMTSENRVMGTEIDTKKTYQRKADGSELNMQDFLNLLTQQLSNQDVMNPQGDTEFIAQMAQFSSLQAMQTLTELTYAQYGASMVGKNVIVAEYDQKTGELVNQTGTVTHVQFMGGKCTVTVNKKEYDMSAIMEVIKDLPVEGEDENSEDPPATGDKDKE